MREKDLKEDRFLGFIKKVTELYYRDRRKFLAGIGIFLVAVIALIFLLQGRSKQTPNTGLYFTEALGYFSTGDVPTAEAKFKEVARRYPSDQLGIKAWFFLGNIYYHSRRFDEAKKAFETFYKKYNKGSFLKPAGLYAIGNSMEELGDFSGASARYQELHKLYPKSPYAPYALLNAGRCYKNTGDFKKAESAFTIFLDEYPTHGMKEEAKAQLAFVQTLENKF